MNITNQNEQDPENYTAGQNKQDTNNTELSPNMSPVTYKKEEPLLVRAVVDNFSAFGVGSILYGLFFCFCIYQNFMAVTSVLLCAATIGYVLFCFKKLSVKTDNKRWFFIISICLLGLSNMLTDSVVLAFLNYVGIILLFFCFLLRHFYDTKEWDFSKFCSALSRTIICSVGRFNYPFKSLQQYLKEHRKRKNTKIYYVFLGILIAIPLLLVVCSLLLSADVVFRSFSDRLFSGLFENIDFGTIFAVVFTICFGMFSSYCILIELAFQDVNPVMENKKTMEPIIAITFSSILTVIYLCFSIIQIAYLFIGNMKLPDGYTYAAYARQGFFQLLFVCLINLVLVLFCQKHYRENKVLKTILTIICGCTYIMIASSTMRMLLYIASYQLTFLRIFVLVSLLTLAICLTGVGISIYKSSFPLFFFMTVTVTVCYLLFSLARPDAITAAYNCQRENVDAYYLSDLSLDAVPAMERAGVFDADGPLNGESYNQILENFRAASHKKSGNMSPRKFNISVYRADRILNK